MNKTIELIQRSQQGDHHAKELLIEENTGLIWAVAKRFIGRGTEADDLYQLGCVGFLKAIEGFDAEYGTQFSTYAVPKIAGEIRRFLRDDGTIKVSRTLKEHAFTVKKCRSNLASVLGREPTISEISKETGLAAEEIAMAETATKEVESIQRESGEEGFTLEDILSDTEAEEGLVEKIALRQAINGLNHKEKMVIDLRYFHGLTQQQVSKIMEVSQVQISRIEKKAILHLKERLE